MYYVTDLTTYKERTYARLATVRLIVAVLARKFANGDILVSHSEDGEMFTILTAKDLEG